MCAFGESGPKRLSPTVMLFFQNYENISIFSHLFENFQNFESVYVVLFLCKYMHLQNNCNDLELFRQKNTPKSFKNAIHYFAVVVRASPSVCTSVQSTLN